MPAIVDKLKINNEKLDKRIKLTKEQKEEIKEIFHTEDISQRKLSLIYGVSRRCIQFILFPEKLVQNQLRMKERGGTKQYYNKEANTLSIKMHRAYKKELLEKGLI